MSEPVTVSVADGLARLTLNRPDAYNTLNRDLAKGLMEAAIRCAHGGDVRAALLTAAGANFCGGGDLKSFHAQDDGIDGHVREVTYYLHAACSAFARMDAPLVIAVQGAAAGAGLSIALLGDLVYAGESAFFTMAYTAAGLSPDGGSTFMLPRVAGLRRAQELTLTNRRLTAAEAVDWGIATAVVPDNDLQVHAAEIAAKLAHGPSRAFGRAKRLLVDSFDSSFESQMEREGRYIAASAIEPDGRAGVDAFVNKRKPAFTGRV